MAITIDGSTGISYPTGPLFDSGTNENGNYLKFPDGTMICTLQAIEDRTGTGVNTTSVTFPATFADIVTPPWNTTPVSVALPLYSTVPNVASSSTVFGVSTTGCTVYINRSSATSTAFSLICYGRWY